MAGIVIKDQSDAGLFPPEPKVQEELLSCPFDLRAFQEIMDEIEDISERLEDEEDDISSKNIESRVKKKGDPEEPGPSMEELSIQSFYEKAREAYSQFLSDYLKEHTTPYNESYSYSFESKKTMQTWAKDTFSYKERIDVVRKMMMNNLFGSMCNHISPDEKERYKVWTMVSKANQQLSFIYRDSVVF